MLIAPSLRQILILLAASHLAMPVAAQLALTDAEKAIALRVQTGRVPCELGQVVSILSDSVAPGHFRLELGKLRYRLAPIETTTGAIRLEDKSAGVVWLQLANKSMLLDHRRGRRIADECRSAEQERVAQAMAARPQASLLDSLPAAGGTGTAQD